MGEVEIAVDAPLGFRRWRVWTSQGATTTRKFVVGDLPEVVEEEIDGTPVPTQVALPVTINGRIFPREDVDHWTFAAVQGMGYTCEVMASRLGIPVSTTHILVGGVLGVGLARGIGALDMRVVGQVLISWVATVPLAAIMSIGFFYLLKAILSP